MKKTIIDVSFYSLLFLTQLLAAIFYGFFHDHITSETDSNSPIINSNFSKFGLFQDIHIMVFVGIGFLFAFLKRHKLSSIAEIFWLAAISVQYYFLWNALFDGAWNGFGHFFVWTFQLIKGEFCAISMVVAVGSIIGKANNLQLLIFVLAGVLLYSINEHILFFSLDVYDLGGSMYIFAFGAFYGVGASWLLSYKQALKSPNFASNVNSNTFALIGTLFLWCFFPSFNSALSATPVQSNIAVVNTYFCLIGSVVGSFFMSSILHQGKYHMEHILNASLVGGILMGSGANLLHESFAAYIVGNFGGILSVVMFKFLTKALKKAALFDVAGVLHSFGVPGIIGGLLSSIYRARYFDRGGIQVAGTFISVGIALAGGAVVGALIRFLRYLKVEEEYFNDSTNVFFDDVIDFRTDVKNRTGRPDSYVSKIEKIIAPGSQIDQPYLNTRPGGNIYRNE